MVSVKYSSLNSKQFWNKILSSYGEDGFLKLFISMPERCCAKRKLQTMQHMFNVLYFNGLGVTVHVRNCSNLLISMSEQVQK